MCIRDSCKTASAKFDETVELHVKLDVDSRYADQQVRGAIVLPNGTGKTARVLVFAKGDKADAAREALSLIHIFLAAGGAAGAKLGGGMDGYQLARQLGHHRTVLYPSLVQVCTCLLYTSLFMDQGVIMEENSPQALFDNPQSPRLQSFLSKVL